jgi:hypothetical protein
MSGDVATAALERALALSRDLADAADSGDAAVTQRLDAERRMLLESARADRIDFGDADRAMLREIAVLNSRALGALQHRQRAMARDLDMLSVGRRAVRAYATMQYRR